MEDKGTHSDVLVAGAGPVGMTTALRLARRGRSVRVLEAGDALSTESRASTFHPPTLDMLYSLGLVDDLRAVGLDVPTFQYRDRTEGVVAELELGRLAPLTKFPFRVQAEQSKLTRIIQDKLRDLPDVDVEFSSAVASFSQDSGGVSVTTADGRTYTADYLVGADGASSVVRQGIGASFEGATYPERYLVISTDADIKQWIPDIAYVNYISDPDLWVVLLRTPAHWRAMFPVREGMSEEEATSPENVQRYMNTIGRPSDGWPILHTTLYRVHQRVASTYRSGRVFLAGDAAHINNPLGGLGMNSGIHDAFLISGLLADRFDGVIDEDGLDRYDEVRRSVSRDYVSAETDKNWRRIRETDEKVRQAEFADLRAMVADDDAHLAFVRRTCMLGEEARLVR
ncbi:Monooxygenase, FAD-binding [Actinomycetales bacterium JB111]|nr:Monooxygenase, FAD-binding [Actinomycetales bacterium JB111]